MILWFDLNYLVKYLAEDRYLSAWRSQQFRGYHQFVTGKGFNLISSEFIIVSTD